MGEVNRLDAGDVLQTRELVDIHGDLLRIPDPRWLVHLQFRRYAGCPVCNLHLRSITRRHEEIVAAGVREVVVFHSGREKMLEFEGGLPFAAIADPEKKLYAEFGVEEMSPVAALRAALSPRLWRAAWRALAQAPSLSGASGRGEEHLGLPAEFLIGPDGRILAARYGRYVDDHWSVDELLDLTTSVRYAAAPSPSSS
ncbi:peroxiredoxin-like family protein [soil metagenome]